MKDNAKFYFVSYVPPMVHLTGSAVGDQTIYGVNRQSLLQVQAALGQVDDWMRVGLCQYIVYTTKHTQADVLGMLTSLAPDPKTDDLEGSVFVIPFEDYAMRCCPQVTSWVARRSLCGPSGDLPLSPGGS